VGLLFSIIFKTFPVFSLLAGAAVRPGESQAVCNSFCAQKHKDLEADGQLRSAACSEHTGMMLRLFQND